MKRLINITGLSGSGKTTFALWLEQETGGVAIAADDFFLSRDGTYQFQPALLPEAHKWCQGRVWDALIVDDDQTVIVHNTGLTQKERQVYRDIAQECGAQYTELIVNTDLSDDQLAARNAHGLTSDQIANQRRKQRGG
jgi:predicted kinase